VRLKIIADHRQWPSIFGRCVNRDLTGLTWYNSAMKNPLKRYHFPPMLGPVSAHPVGSFQHGLCLGNEFDYMTERAFHLPATVHLG
jgi:hypothetical protein